VKIADVFRGLFSRQAKPPQPNVPGADDYVAANFVAETQRQAAEYETRMTQIVSTSDDLNTGTQSGVCFISFSKRK
jgi:hypothetical protein